MSGPRWLLEGAQRCPVEAANVDRCLATFKTLPKDAPLEDFFASWRRCESAMQRLKAAWRALEPAK